MAKVLVIGASRGIGLETVMAALRAVYSVRALARLAASIPVQDAGLDKVSGDAFDRDAIRNALQDVDVVIQTLGVDFSPWLIFEGTRLFSAFTGPGVRLVSVGGCDGTRSFLVKPIASLPSLASFISPEVAVV